MKRFAILMAAILIFGCLQPSESKKPDGKPPLTFPDANTTIPETPPSVSPPPDKEESNNDAIGNPPAATPPPKNASSGIWIPKPGTSFQWQLTGKIDPSVAAEIYDIDLFDTSKEDIEALHKNDRKVICYLSAGSWEDWRPDNDELPVSVIGKEYEGWEGENWLDIRRIDLLSPTMLKRLDLAKQKGCDGIEPDNIDAYEADTGFPLTYQDQLNYNKWLAEEAHKRGLSIGLKNDEEQVQDLVQYFDWALTEDCFDQYWCDSMKPFITSGKAVFMTEYTDTGVKTADFCPYAKKANYTAILKNRDLDSWIEKCP